MSFPREEPDAIGERNVRKGGRETKKEKGTERENQRGVEREREREGEREGDGEENGDGKGEGEGETESLLLTDLAPSRPSKCSAESFPTAREVTGNLCKHDPTSRLSALRFPPRAFGPAASSHCHAAQQREDLGRGRHASTGKLRWSTC
eukprot:749927-Hanusia_phi.AAC.4